MCVALPGKIISIDNDTAEVDFNGNTVSARGASLVDASVGDRVLVHAGCILQVVREDDADILDEIMREVGAF